MSALVQRVAFKDAAMRTIAYFPLLLAACVAAPAPVPPAVDLVGEWRVAEIDGESLDRPYGIALSANGERIWWDPSCAGQGANYTITGSSFATATRSNPGVVCEIGYPPEVPQIWDALDAADAIERTPANGIRIHGNGRSVTLFSQ